MRWKDAASIESTIWDLRLSDQVRATNRALILDLFNGLPPYSEQEATQNRITSNLSNLSANRIFHDSTRQFSNAFLRADNYFTVSLDTGPKHKRDDRGRAITRELGKIMKRSSRYRQTLRNVFAQLILHGVGPVVWNDKYRWCPSMQEMCDVMVPSQTLLTMENLSYFAVYRRYTAAQLVKFTRGPKRDKGWDVKNADAAILWAGKQTGGTVSGVDWNWSPERIAESVKENSGYFSSDQVPTVNCWDFYFQNDEDDAKTDGWNRRIVFDIPSAPEVSDGKITASTKNIIGGRNQYLYDSGSRVYSPNYERLIHFQFADGSVGAPYRYHSVRSLGFLLYALCHLNNRLHCKIVDATFESLLNYIRVTNPDDTERMKKIDLISQGFLPEGFQFVSQNERWKINQELVTLMINLMRQQMSESSPSFNQDFGSGDNSVVEKTATQITAELNKASASVGSILNEAYIYQQAQYEEIARRFCIPNSIDADVREFRVNCLNKGVPVEYLDATLWNISVVRVMGSGNKQLEIAQAKEVMSIYQLLDPDAQRVAKRDLIFAVTDDPSKVDQLVPQEEQVSRSVTDAQSSAPALLMGLPTDLKEGVNHGEYSATLLGMMQAVVQRTMQSGGVGDPQLLAGLQNLAGQSIDGQPIPGNGIMNHINILSQDKEAKSEVKQLSDALGKLMNEVKAMAQRQQEVAQQQQEQNGNGNGLPAEAAVKLKSQLVLAEAKAENSKLSHQQKLEQKQQSHQQKMEIAQQNAQLTNANRIRETQVAESIEDVKAAAEIGRESKKAVVNESTTAE